VASLLSKPPRSPSLNPIEKAWAQLKEQLRAAGARTADALDQVITGLPRAICPPETPQPGSGSCGTFDGDS
jgi:transposase